MGIFLGALEAADQFFNQGRGTKFVGDKVGQFGHWIGDQIGANPNYGKLTPREIDTSRYDQDRANQTNLLAQLQAQANGTGPSMAQGLLQQATDQGIKQSMALGAAQQGQGLGYASALRNIADQSAAARQQGAGQAALLKNQEMLQGQNQLGGLLSGMAGNDLGLGGQQAQLGLSYDLANQQAQLQQGNKLPNVLGGLGQGIASGAGMMAGKPPGMASGGLVDSPANDTVPAMLSPGEFVMKRSAVQALGEPTLEAMNEAGESPNADALRSEFMAEVHGGGRGPGAHLAKMDALEKRIAALEGKKRKAA